MTLIIASGHDHTALNWQVIAKGDNGLATDFLVVTVEPDGKHVQGVYGTASKALAIYAEETRKGN